MRLLYKTAVMYGAWDMGSEESARDGLGGNEDVEMDMWSHKAGENKD